MMHQAVRDTLKKGLMPLLRPLLGILPVRALESAIKAKRSLLDYLPPGRCFVFKKYLGDIAVNIDTTYGIERQWLTGSYDPDILAAIDFCVKPGDICLDIGANAGAVSFALAKKTGAGGRVYALEPGRTVFNRLCANIALNPAYRQIIMPFWLGISDRQETRTWIEDPRNPGNASFVMLENGNQERLTLMALDDFVRSQGIDRINFIKIDVEGMEYEVITGGLESIGRFKPVLYYETGFFEKGFWAELKRGDKIFLKIERMLTDLGYSFHKITPGGLQETRYPDLAFNTLALPRAPQRRHID